MSVLGSKHVWAATVMFVACADASGEPTGNVSAAISGPKTNQLHGAFWFDANQNLLPVVAASTAGFGVLLFTDTTGVVWSYDIGVDPQNASLGPNYAPIQPTFGSDAHLSTYFTSADCSGAAYILPLVPARYSVGLYDGQNNPASYVARPDALLPVTINIGSRSDQGLCSCGLGGGNTPDAGGDAGTAQCTQIVDWAGQTVSVIPVGSMTPLSGPPATLGALPFHPEFIP